MTRTVKCRNCREAFEARIAELNRGNGRFCSRSCAADYGNKHRPHLGRKKLTYREKKERYGTTFALGQIVGRVRGRAKKAGVFVDLTTEEVRTLFDETDGRCGYTGRKMLVGHDGRSELHMDSLTIDRIDPDLGYTKSNIVLCCRWVNSAKCQGTLADLKERARELLA